MVASLLRQPGVRFDVAVVAVCLGLTVSHLAGASLATSCAAATVVAAVAVLGIPAEWRLATGVTAWALMTGFVENRYGELTFAHDDLFRLGVMVVSVVAIGALVLPTSQPSARIPSRYGGPDLSRR